MTWSSDLVFAEDGAQALAEVEKRADQLSLILLDLILPDMHGLDILRTLKAEPRCAAIPVIIMTSDKDSEVESLTIGASDFIPKPYPMPKVVQARILRTIELSEDRDIIRSTERDSLTGLYNRDYFYRYAEQFDLHHKDMSMDAIVVDVNHFHMINERYGKAYGDEVLKRIGEKVRDIVKDSGGIVCRREADTFLVYCPHRTDYAEILEQASAGLAGEGRADSRVRLRMGVYSDVDKTLEIERRFDRAKLAAGSARSSFARAIAIYDNALHESEIFAEQLLEDFEDAVREKQFVVFYQPKFDIRPADPALSSAEALVRWKHPTLGMVSPGVFIPLLEKNGLIQELDRYVWRETAAQIRDWKNRLGRSVPVSVNVSRIDLFDPDLTNLMERIVTDNGLEPSELLLEITESAYTQDSDRIIAAVKQLRDKGFRIEMDDFGSGYSSLNMISSLPIDALKLDMQFIRHAFQERKNTRMLEVVIDIADSLGVPTIAEGVETAEQLFTLRSMGCDIVQGYYFSRPVPDAEFEPFLLKDEAVGASEAKADETRPARSTSQEKFTYDALHDPMTGLYNYSAFDMLLKDADQEHIAVMIADVDDYKSIVEEYGLNAADEVIMKVTSVLRQSFRSVDLLCRIRKDEFAIIMTRVNSSMRKLIFDKVEAANRQLREISGEVGPHISLSVGVAFGDRENPRGTIFQDADTALYRMKEVRRCECAIY